MTLPTPQNARGAATSAGASPSAANTGADAITPPENTASAPPLSAGDNSPDAVSRGEAALSRDEVSWVKASELRAHLGYKSNKSVHQKALADGWPTRRVGNRWEYQPPAALLVVPEPVAMPAPPEIRFHQIKSHATRKTVEARGEVMQIYLQSGTKAALKHAKTHFPHLKISPRSLTRWRAAYHWFGLDGLVDQKQGKVGRKALASSLRAETRRSLVAASIEYGVGGRQNFARAARELAMDPDLTFAERHALKTVAASKSHVPPSIRDAARLDPTTITMCQIGDRAARKDTLTYTPGEYSDVPPGRVITADDMTANVYIWLPWPNQLGYKVMRPQLLAMVDVGSLAFTNFRVLCRENGQYNKDDVWGLIGDYFDKFGLPEACLFEAGTWRSNEVRGVRTGLDDDTRYGGLKSLGVKLLHSRLPHSKHVEQRFNDLQYASDRCRGYAGRAEREDQPEALKHQLYQVGKGQIHPREYFLSLSEYADHMAAAITALNDERNDGKICRGESPFEIFSAHPPSGKTIPPDSRWLYRSSFRLVRVSQRGHLIIRERSGKYARSHMYRDAAGSKDLAQWAGREVGVYWNQHTPQDDAIIMRMKAGAPDGYLCSAKYVEPQARFDATKEQLTAEARYKSAQLGASATIRKELMPHFQRDRHVVQVTDQTQQIGRERQAAARERQQTNRQREAVARTDTDRLATRYAQLAEDD